LTVRFSDESTTTDLEVEDQVLAVWQISDFSYRLLLGKVHDNNKPCLALRLASKILIITILLPFSMIPSVATVD
jgi:hypothetical protein